MRELMRVFRREVGAYFASPVAYLFIGAFLAVTLFVFFWAEAFFARNVADLRPLFEWLPVLLIALVAALTMRSWSEERRAETLEVLMTAPVSSTVLVGGKFLAVLALVAISLALTLPLALTVEALGPLDWGPVLGGYVASGLLAAAYVAIGLAVSARTDNQVVSLIVTALLGGAFYVVGTGWLTALAPETLARAMRLVGTGARFDDITRGVLDLRDLYYYLSLTGVFLALNVYSLDRLRWAGTGRGAPRHAGRRAVVALVVLNLLAANLWLQPISRARADLTETDRYTLAEATELYLGDLREPLVLRGYVSERTHPLLKPLVPELKDLLREYRVAGGRDVRVEIVDPQADAAAAREARRRYGIEPVPLESASRYQASVVNAYFHVLVKYGDQHEVIDFRDLIEVKGGAGADLSVSLGNVEYTLTSAIREVAYQWRNQGRVFASIDAPVTFHAYLSPAGQLPERLATLRGEALGLLEELEADSDGKLRVEVRDPEAGDGALAERLADEYGFRPMTTSLFDERYFWFYMVLEQNGRTVPVPLPESLERAQLEKAITSALQRFGEGFLKTVAVYAPGPSAPARMPMARSGERYRTLLDELRRHAVVERTELSSGHVPANAQALLVLSPRGLDAAQRFAIDQFLMRGGTVVIAASPIDVSMSRQTGISASKSDTGLAGWLGRYGVTIEERLVLDPQSGALTLPTRGPAGGVRLETIDYPLFVDVREDGLADVPILGGIGQVTMAWTSPVRVEAEDEGELTVRTLVESSPRSWATEETRVMPDYRSHPTLGFARPGTRGRQPLAVMLEGRFDSAFRESGSPLGREDAEDASGDAGSDADAGDDAPAGSGSAEGEAQQAPAVRSVVTRSPAGSRLVVFGSGEFLTDTALQIVGGTNRTAYGHPVQLVQNVVDASLEDPLMLAIRRQSHYTRLLRPVSDEARTAWEAANYGIALAGLGLLFGVERIAATRRRRRYERILALEAR